MVESFFRTFLIVFFLLMFAFVALATIVIVGALTALLSWLLGVVWWKVAIIIVVTCVVYTAVAAMLD